MGEGKIRQYLLYATGEILLVVIGILIALQVNNWNTNRLDRIEERALLFQLKNEFISNKEQLEAKIELRALGAESTLRLLKMIDDNTNRYSASAVHTPIANALPVYTFDPQNGVMAQLVDAGKLNLVMNDTLRELISNWNGIIIDLKENEDNYLSFNHNDFRPFLYTYTDYRSIINWRIKNGTITSTLLDEKYEDTREIGNSVNPVQMDELLSSREFENYLASLFSHLSYVNAQSYGIRDYMNNVIDIIDNELEVK